MSRLLRQLGEHLLRRASRPRTARSAPPSSPPAPTSPPTSTATRPGDSRAYPGDHEGLPQMRWAPPGGARPSPGEVVWTWVPYEEDHSRGKDRPVLVVADEGRWLLALPLTSADHDLDEDQERRSGRHWIDIGAGDWDRQHRRSEARLDRVVRVDPTAVRRAGGGIPASVFSAVADAMRAVAQGRPYDDDPV